jgi:hypothetical protein
LFLRTSVPVALRAAPHQTVSQSEAGFEKIFQAACVELEWAVPAGTHEVTITLQIDHTSAGER